MKKLYLVFLLCVYAYVVVAQVVPRRNLGQRNLGALQQYIEISNARYDAAIAYKSGIEKYYGELVTKNELSSEALNKLKSMKDESLKRIDDKATYGDYSRAVDIAEYEYKTTTAAMLNVARKDIEEQKEYIRQEQQRMYRYTHPFDYISYDKYSRVIQNPTYETLSTVQITKVALSSQETRVEFKVNNRANNGYISWVSINSGTYIYLPLKKQKLKMRDAINIAVAPLKTEFHFQDEELVFALVFPALPQNTRTFSIIEPADSSWKFYNIKIK